MIGAVAILVGAGLAVWRLTSGGGHDDQLALELGADVDATVVRVSDGDTVVVAPLDRPEAQEKVRLLALDAPGRGERWFDESSAALAKLTAGKTVRLEFEVPGEVSRDKHGRLLAYLTINGANASVEMVRQGWSRYSQKYGGERFAPALEAAEKKARAQRVGIWAP